MGEWIVMLRKPRNNTLSITCVRASLAYIRSVTDRRSSRPLPVPLSPADPGRFHDWTAVRQPFLPSRLPDLTPTATADFYCDQHCLQFLRFARNSIGGDIGAHEGRPMLHTWAGFRYGLPAADASGRAAQVCALTIASILFFSQFYLLRGGFPQWFAGQLWLPLFLEAPGTGARVRGASRAAISR